MKPNNFTPHHLDPDDPTTLSDFNFIQELKTGIYWKVFLTYHKFYKKNYAIKVIRKDKLHEEGTNENAQLEA